MKVAKDKEHYQKGDSVYLVGDGQCSIHRRTTMTVFQVDKSHNTTMLTCYWCDEDAEETFHQRLDSRLVVKVS